MENMERDSNQQVRKAYILKENQTAFRNLYLYMNSQLKKNICSEVSRTVSVHIFTMRDS